MSLQSGDHGRALGRRTRRLARLLRIPIELSIVDDAAMTRLCLTHLGKNKTTDVLSFEPEAPLPGIVMLTPGQIVLNDDAILRQAPRTDAAACLEEASSLLVHGAAHLVGHDHATRQQARAMFQLERRLARRLGLSWLPRPYGTD